MFLSTQLIMPFRYHVTNVGVRAVTTTMDQGGCILLRHTLLYCRLVTIKPQAKKILFREPYSNSFLYFCYIFAMWQCGQLQKRFLFFMYVYVRLSVTVERCTVRTLVLSGLSLLTDDVVRYIPKNCPLMETLDVSGCVQLTDCR